MSGRRRSRDRRSSPVGSVPRSPMCRETGCLLRPIADSSCEAARGKMRALAEGAAIVNAEA
jgi:hypothetical protein